MLVTVGDLLEAVKDSDMELIAGENGLKNTVRWVHIVENIEVSTFLEGGEIAMITGIGLDSGSELLPLIHCIVEHGASAIIINTGPHISKIDADVSMYCNQNDIPLFTVPWHIHIAEIMNKLCFMITSAGQKNMELSAALKCLVYRPEQAELYKNILVEEGFNAGGFYCVAVLSLGAEVGVRYTSWLNDSLQAYFGRISANVNSFVRTDSCNEVILIFKSEDKTDSQYLASLLNEAVEHTYSSGFNHQLLLGIGDCARGIGEISQSYKQAEAVIRLNRKSISSEISYCNLGMYKLLYRICESEDAKEFVNSALGGIMKYDAENKTDLAQLLRVYLKNNGSVQDTAAALSVHRNTVNYKIKKFRR
jgi:ActR/RegA family two-component response regulator